MNFLTPMAGLIAAGIAVPLLVMLYFLKLRRREEVVPSTVLWRKAIQDLQVNAPFQRLRRNLLLLLQLLILLALAAALAQPTVPFKPSAGKRSVLLIDRSASMNMTDGDAKGAAGVTRLDEAKRRARDLVSTLGSGGQAMVIAFDERAEIVQGFTSDTQLLSRAIDAIRPTDRRTRLKLAYQLADAQMTMRGAGSSGEMLVPPDVWVYSDGRVLDASELSIRSEVKYEKLGSDRTHNVGIVSLSARRNYERPGEVQVFARLANSGPEPVDADVQLTVDGQVQRIARVSLLPTRWSEAQREASEKAGRANKDAVEFTLDLPAEGVVRVEQMLKEKDALASDDAASVVVPPPKTLTVTLVSNGNNPFVAKVLADIGVRDLTEVSPEQYEANLPAGRDVIVFDAYRPRKLPDTGNFVYLGTLPDGLRLTARKAGEALVQRTDAAAVLDLKRDHPILRGLTLSKIVAQGTLELRPASESEVLVEGTDGPMLVLHREGRSIHLALSFDPLYSNFPVNIAWPIFFHNTLQFLATAGDLSVRESYAPGATPRLPRTALAGTTSLTLAAPDGARQTVTVPPEGDVALPSLERTGVYTLTPPPPGFERLAVNLLDEPESDALPADAPPGGLGQAVETGTGKTRLELWWWLVLALAIPVLLVEWWVYTRRTHL